MSIEFPALIGGSARTITPAEIREAICAAHNCGWEIALLTHEKPDFDAISSALWLAALINYWTGLAPQIYFDGSSRVEKEIFSGKPLTELAEVFATKLSAGEQLFLVATDCHNSHAANVCSSVKTSKIPQLQMALDHHVIAAGDNTSGILVVDQDAVAAIVLLVEIFLDQFGTLAQAATQVQMFNKLAALALLGIITDSPDANLRQELEEIQISSKRGQKAIELLKPLADRNYYEQQRSISRSKFEKGLERALKDKTRTLYKAHTIDTAFIGILELGFEFLPAQVADVIHDSGDATLVVVAGITTQGELKFAFRNGCHGVADKIASMTLGNDPQGRARGGGHRVKGGGMIKIGDELNRDLLPSEDDLKKIGSAFFDYYTSTPMQAALNALLD